MIFKTPFSDCKHRSLFFDIMSLLGRVSGAFKRHAFIGSMVVYGSLYGSGDLTRQTLQHVPSVDYMNAARMAAVGGMILAPAYFTWYKVLDRFLVGTSARTIAMKVLVDQCIAGSCGIVLFYTGMSVLERRQALFDELKSKGLNTFMAGCSYWPLVQVVNFRFAPAHLRTVFVAAAGFIWCIILSYIKSFPLSRDEKPLPKLTEPEPLRKLP